MRLEEHRGRRLDRQFVLIGIIAAVLPNLFLVASGFATVFAPELLPRIHSGLIAAADVTLLIGLGFLGFALIAAIRKRPFGEKSGAMRFLSLAFVSIVGSMGIAALMMVILIGLVR